MKQHNKKNKYLLSSKQIRFFNKFLIFIIIFIFVISLIWYFKLNLYFSDKYLWYNHFGNKYDSISDDARALQYARKAVRLDRERPEAHRLMVEVYVRERKFDKAKKELIILKELNESPFYYRHMGFIMLKQDMIDESLHFFKKGIEKYAYSVSNHIGVSLAYLKLNDTENAFKYLNQGKDLAERSLQDNPLRKRSALAQIHAGLGFAYQKKGLHQKAIEEFEIAESISRNSVYRVSNLIS